MQRQLESELAKAVPWVAPRQRRERFARPLEELHSFSPMLRTEVRQRAPANCCERRFHFLRRVGIRADSLDDLRTIIGRDMSCDDRVHSEVDFTSAQGRDLTRGRAVQLPFKAAN